MQGWPALRGTFEGYWNSDETKLFTAATSVDGCKDLLPHQAGAQ